MKIVLLVTTILSLIVPTKKALHMFQQNRYETTRYTMWLQDFLSKNKKSVVISSVFFIVAFVVGVIFSPTISALVVLYYSLSIMYTELNKQYIQPLVKTARVYRQIIVMVILYIILLFIAYFTDYNVLVYTMLFSPIIPYVMIYLMHLITHPIEQFVKSLFKKDAIKVLNSTNVIKIGITGSYGKTSSKNIINEVLSEQFYTLPTPASFNTPMGITITIREQLKRLHEVFIVEMGADKVGDIVELSDFIKPDYAVITSIGPQHLSTFKTIDNIINEKMSLVEKLSSDGVAILNKDNQYIRDYVIKNNVKSISYGIENEAVDYLAFNIKYSIHGSTFDVRYNDEVHSFKTRLLGTHNVLNILSAIALGRALNVDWDILTAAVEHVKFIPHRLELKTINGKTFIDNAFNSNPEGANMSLTVMSMMEHKRFIITPGMIDLGVIQDEENYKFGYNMIDKVDVVLLVGRHQTKPIYDGLSESNFNLDNVHIFDTVKEALAYVYNHAGVEDVILLENDLPDAFSN